MSRMIELARAGRATVAPAPETYIPVSEQGVTDDFIAWMREHDGAGWWAACEIKRLFAQFCEECDRPRLDIKVVGRCMLNYPGVYRKRHSLKGPFLEIGKAIGKERAVLYFIPPSEIVPGPWPGPARPEPGPCHGNDKAEPWQSHDSAMDVPGQSRGCAMDVAGMCHDNRLTMSEQQELCEASIR